MKEKSQKTSFGLDWERRSHMTKKRTLWPSQDFLDVLMKKVHFIVLLLRPRDETCLQHL